MQPQETPPQAPNQQYNQPQPEGQNTVLAMPVAPIDPQKNPGNVLGIVSIVLGLLPILNLVGIVLGIVSIVKSKKANKPSTLGIVGLVLSVFMVFLTFILVSLVIVSYQGVQNKAKEALAQSYESSVYSSVGAYYAKNFTYPQSAAEVEQTLESVDQSDVKTISVVDGLPNSTEDIGYLFCSTNSAQIVRLHTETKNMIIRPLGRASEIELCSPGSPIVRPR